MKFYTIIFNNKYMNKILNILQKGVRRKIAIFSLFSLLINLVMIGNFETPAVKLAHAQNLEENIDIDAKALLDHGCNSNEWHFIINQVNSSEHAPESIQVHWNNGSSEDINLANFTGKVAHYSTTSNLDLQVTKAKANIYSSWIGQFNLSHGPCDTEEPETGHIIVDKITDPAGDEQIFHFLTEGSDYDGFSLSDTSDPNNQELAVGSYSVTESLMSGWAQTDVECASSITDKIVDNTAINLSANEIVTCTFTNTKIIEPTDGSITICKIITNEEDKIVNGAENTGIFTVAGLEVTNHITVPDNVGIIEETVFNTSINLNSDLIGNDEINDAECKTYDNLVYGSYYYAEELVEGENWKTPLYNDQFNKQVTSLADFYTYSGELFNDNNSDDNERNTNADGHIVLSENVPNITLVVLNQYETPQYGPYCGDGTVNQEWEECDSGSNPEIIGCSVQCQIIGTPFCSEDVFAKVSIDDVQNFGTNANMTSDVFFGQNSLPIPQGVWTAVFYNGSYINDTEINEDVPGLAIQRNDGQVTTRIFGSHSCSNTKEHVSGNIEFYNAKALTGIESETGQNQLENGFDGVKSVTPGQDEVWLDGNKSNFWMTVATADDGYITSYSTPKCNIKNETGHIIVDKITDPAGDEQIFHFLTVGSDYDGFSLSDTSAPNNQELAIGSYSVTESLMSGWTQTDVECASSITDKIVDNTAINLTNDEIVTCIFANKKNDTPPPPTKGHLIVQKTTIPAGETTAFVITTSGNGIITGGGAGTITDALDMNYEVTTGTYSVTETATLGWTETSNDCQEIEIAAGETKYCTITNTKDVTIVASKIICEDEKYLPNWGTVWTEENQKPDSITENTAQKYVDDSEGKCFLINDWEFEWGNQNALDPGSSHLGYGGNEWTTFSSPASIDIDGISELRLREVLQEGYIPFTYPNNENTVSAEFYCSDDILNYDNYDFIPNPQIGETYYCVAFNSEIETPEPKGHLIVQKTTIPAGDTTAFVITTSGNGIITGGGAGTITDALDMNYEVTAGTYSVTETATLGWTENSNDCQEIEIAAGEIKYCTITNTKKNIINKGDIIINELMWMGSEDDTADEWIELKNTTQSPIDDLNDCKLYKKNGGEIADLSGLSIKEEGYLIVSRKSRDDSNIDIVPDLISSSISLSNSELEIKLICGETLIDTAGDGGNPLDMAGDKVDPKKSMSRKSIQDGTLADSWCTAVTQKNWDTGAKEFGTPGAPNVCEIIEPTYGSITGCKYRADMEGNFLNPEQKLSDWEIILTQGELKLTTTTGETGCYSFDELEMGTYKVSEGNRINNLPFVQTFPTEPSYYELTIDSQNPNHISIDFGNYLYECSDGIDNDGDTFTDINDPTCHSDGDPNDNDDTYLPQKNNELNTPPIITISDTVTIFRGDAFNEKDHATANDAEDGVITDKITLESTVNTGVVGSYTVKYDVKDSEGADANQKILTVNVIERGCTSNCGGGGSTVITIPAIIITNEKVIYLGDGKAKVTWTTNIETTEQVAYGDNSLSDNSNLGDLPTYGYDSVNDESNFMVKEHSVIISGLTDGIPYYFRPIADRAGSTGEKIGIEVMYIPPEKGEVKGVKDPVEKPEEPCNYLLEYIKLGENNNPVEVQKLESFLNIFESEDLAINGIYEQVDFDAVSRFQEKYFEKVLSPWNHDSATGYVYITTKKRINEIYCEREFPLTKKQAEEVARYASLFGIRAPSTEQPTYSSDEEMSMGATTTPESEIESTEGENEGTEGPQIGLGDEEESGEVAGTTDEVNADNGEGESKEFNSETEEEVVYADSGYSNLYFWIPVILLLIIFAIIYYVTKMKKGGNDAGSSGE